MTLSDKLLEKLVCPQCHAPIQYHDSDDSLVCEDCRLRFRVTDGVPVLLLDEAEKID